MCKIFPSDDERGKGEMRIKRGEGWKSRYALRRIIAVSNSAAENRENRKEGMREEQACMTRKQIIFRKL